MKQQARKIEINTAQHPLSNGNPPDWASGWGQDQYGVFVEFTFGSVTQKMRWIPPGKFKMGSPEEEPGRYDDESPQHSVEIKEGYWLFDTPVTQALWLEVMGENPSKFDSETRPVEQVSWDDCQKFFNKINQQVLGLNLGLPSEAMWEYACRAGTKTIYSFGDNAEELHQYAWFSENAEKKTHSVAEKKPNQWGLHDMLGNVWEWVADVWHAGYEGAPLDGAAWLESASETGRVVRGGSWFDSARYCRSAYRGRSGSGYRSGNLGFRPARVQDPLVGAQPELSEKAAEAEPAALRLARGAATALKFSLQEKKIVQSIPEADELRLRSDRGVLILRKMQKPAWADAMGRDRYGLWFEFVVEDVRQRMRWIAPGSFLMGSPEDEVGRSRNERVQQAETLTKGYWLFDTPVTQALWLALMGSNPSYHRPVEDNLTLFQKTKIKMGFAQKKSEIYPNHPVERVSWDECQAFLKNLSFRLSGMKLALPSEAQWEYACRAGTITPFSSGEDVDPTRVNYNGNASYHGTSRGEYRGKTMAVKSWPANPWGLYEMHGNIHEWCQDSRSSAGRGDHDPSATAVARVYRGGCWHSAARECRSAFANWSVPHSRDTEIGFRPICEGGF